MSDCVLPVEAVNEAFLAAPPLISSQILDLTIKHPNWLRDLPQLEEFPRGNGTIGQQLIFRGEMPQIERGLQAWKKLGNNTGCGDLCSPDCGYNWTVFGGHGIDRKVFELMKRDFRSPDYCITEIQTTAHFEQIMAMTVQTLYRQVDFFKEINIGQNVLTMLAKKFMVDSGGAKGNTQDPYSYRPLGTAQLAMLNVTMLQFFYEWMRKLPDCIPYDVVNGSPIFALECSEQLLSDLYRIDQNMRQDVRWSNSADALLTKYNFITTVKGMFLPAPILFPRRFNWVAATPVVAGHWEEVLPFVKGIPAEVGSFTGFNPDYEAATYEEVLLHGKFPFKVYYLPTETTLGQNTNFGPEYSYFNAWKWVNPETRQDPFRRVGYFATSATIGVAPQWSDGIFGILVARPSVKSMAMFYPETLCPPTPVECDNEVPAVTCPCPVVLEFSPNPVTAGNYFITLAVPTDAVRGNTLQFGLEGGGYITGTVAAVDASGYHLEVTLPRNCNCNRIISIYCDDTLGCYSEVLSATDCRSSATGQVKLYLKRPIKAMTEGDVILATFGDGTTQHLQVCSVDICKNLWYVSYADGYGPTDDPDCSELQNQGHCGNWYCDGDMLCDRCGIISVCVPPETDATCPDCGTYTVIPCGS